MAKHLIFDTILRRIRTGKLRIQEIMVFCSVLRAIFGRLVVDCSGDWIDLDGLGAHI